MLSGIAASGAALGFWLWPSRTDQAAYPFARRVSGDAELLWRIRPEALELASHDDAGRLRRYVGQLKQAVASLENAAAELATAKVGELGAVERSTLRELWWQAFEPILALDDIKQRYRGWYGLDFFSHPKLHARAFALCFAALCAQVDGGLRILEVVAGNALARRLFDEAMPELGLPRGTFSALRQRLGRVSDLFYVPVGDEWYERWLERHLASDAGSAALRSELDRARKAARSRVLAPTTAGIENKLEIVQSGLFVAWFPLQKGIAEWAGDTRFAKSGRRLINDKQLVELKRKLEPGDILLERRNWYLSNIGLPGFWPHAALYAGTQRQILGALGRDPAVRARLGDLDQRFRARYPRAWASLAERDAEGHEQTVIEAVSEGVVTTSLEHSCGADYVAVLRPRVTVHERVRAIERALLYWGRSYDFNFDFATDDQLVCSELVIKAFEPDSNDESGLQVPYVQIAGRRALPPTELVRAFARDRNEAVASPRFEFVYFLEGLERKRSARVSGADALAKTVDRPKWDIAQP